MITISKGFTLIELMIVVGIIAALAAIAIPAFSEYRAKSCDALAQADAHNAAFVMRQAQY